MNGRNDLKHLAAISRRRFIAGTGLAVAGLSANWTGAWSGTTDEISRTGESIHQRRSFAASRLRVYEALTLTAQFDQVVQMSAAVQSAMKLGTSPTAIDNTPGGVFTLFGGHISGRFIELVPHERIVQAWRVANWDPGSYSIARYELSEEGNGTQLVFDHTGFPSGQADHLAAGWIGNYWQPLARFLAQGGPADK